MKLFKQTKPITTQTGRLETIGTYSRIHSVQQCYTSSSSFAAAGSTASVVVLCCTHYHHLSFALVFHTLSIPVCVWPRRESEFYIKRKHTRTLFCTRYAQLQWKRGWEMIPGKGVWDRKKESYVLCVCVTIRRSRMVNISVWKNCFSSSFFLVHSHTVFVLVVVSTPSSVGHTS